MRITEILLDSGRFSRIYCTGIFAKEKTCQVRSSSK